MSDNNDSVRPPRATIDVGRALACLLPLSSLFLCSAALCAPDPSTSKPQGPPVESSVEARRDVSITAYNNNLALVREVRELASLPRGQFDLYFLDVPARINPRTVALRSLEPTGDLTILEQNYEYDLTSPSRLLEKYVGRELELVETGENLEERVTHATLLSTNEGNIFRIGDRIHIGHPGRVVVPKLPEGLFSRPTLVWRLTNSGPSSQRVEASYLTDGVSWSADYVAVGNADTTRIDLTGWITLENRSGAAFRQALLKLVAGQVQRIAPPMMEMAEAGIAKRMAAPSFAEQPFFEYHLYTLDRRTDIEENETKQILLLEAGGVPVRKRLMLTGEPNQYRGMYGTMQQSQPVGVFLEMRNSKDAGLGMPLPAGIVRVYQKDRDGAEQFAGEDRIEHTPRDEKVVLRLGSAFDVVADRVQTDWKKTNVAPYDAETAFEIRIRNHKDEPVTVTVRETLPQAEWKLLQQSPEAKKIDARTLEFELAIPANGESVVRYRVALKM